MAAQVNYILAAVAVPAFFLAGRADLELHVPYPVIRHRHSVKSLADGEVSATHLGLHHNHCIFAMAEQQRRRALAARDPTADNIETALKVGVATGMYLTYECLLRPACIMIYWPFTSCIHHALHALPPCDLSATCNASHRGCLSAKPASCACSLPFYTSCQDSLLAIILCTYLSIALFSYITTDMFLAGVGFMFGGAVGILKNLPLSLSAGVTSLQSFGLGAVFTFTRLSVIQAWTTELQTPTPGDLIKATAIAGAFSGGSLGALFRGRKNVIPGAIMWCIFGATGQFMYNRRTLPAQRAEPKGPGFWQSMSDKSWTPFKVLSNEEYAGMLKEKLLRVEAEISIIDDKIAAMKGQQQAEVAREGEAAAKKS